MKTDISDLLLLLATLKAEPLPTVSGLAGKLGRSAAQIHQMLAELVLIAVPPDIHGVPALRLNLEIKSLPGGDSEVKFSGINEFEQALPLLPAEGQLLLMALEEFGSRVSDRETGACRGLQQLLRGVTGTGGTGLARARHGRQIREWIELARQAIDLSLRLEVSYYSGERSEFTEGRLVRPDHLLEQQGHVYLRGYCELRAAPRSFRLDRIRSMKLTRASFDPKLTPKHSSQPSPVPGWDGIGPSDQRITVRVRAAAAELLATETLARGGSVEWLTSKSLPDLDPSEWAAELSVPAYGPEWSVTWVLRHGPNAELIAPDHLRTRLVGRLDRMKAGLTPASRR